MNRKKGGRPRLGEQKRVHKKEVSLSRNELEEVERLAFDSGLSAAELFRRSVLSADLSNPINEREKDTWRKVKGMAVNLNQVVRKINSQGSDGIVNTSELQAIIIELKKLLK